MWVSMWVQRLGDNIINRLLALRISVHGQPRAEVYPAESLVLGTSTYSSSLLLS